MATADLADRALAREELDLRRARRSLPDFCAYVFGLELAEHHLRWVEAIEAHPRVVVVAPIEHGKSTVVSMAYPLFRLGNDPNLRILLVSETHAQASRLLASMREAMDANPRLRAVFPRLRPAPSRDKWSDSELVVERDTSLKDASILAVGVGGALLGARVDLAICDDVVSWGNSSTPGQRESVIAWYKSTLVGRITAAGKIVCVGTPWSPDDLLGQLERGSEYLTVRTPAIQDDGSPLWPEQWPLARLEQRRREIGELEYSRQMLLRVLSDTESRFKLVWFEEAFRNASAAGVTLVESYDGPLRTYTGVDLAIGDGPQHDESCLFTIAVEAGRQSRRRVLCIERGRWQAPELISRLKATFQRFRSRIRVESNAAQAYLVQWLREAKIPVEAAYTSRNKHDPVLGVESMAIELARGQWLIPDSTETRRWMRELIDYTPIAHAGDSVMASWLARGAALRDEQDRPLPVLTSGSRDDLDRYRREGIFVSRPCEMPADTDDVGLPLPRRF